MRTSYSALETFRQCPQKYKFQELDKIKTPKSKEAVFGTVIHGALKFMFSQNPLFPTVDEIMNHYRASWNTAEISSLSQEEKQAYATQGEDILRRFFIKNQPWNFSIVDLESRFELTLKDPKTGHAHVLAGIIDRIDKPSDNAYEIIDYKTTRKMKSQQAVDEDLQLALYQLALLDRWPHVASATIHLSLYYLKHNEKITTQRSIEHARAAQEQALRTIRDIEQKTETNIFPPQPSVLCDWCGYKTLCPAWKFLYSAKQSVQSNAQDMEQIITEYFMLKKQEHEIKKRFIELQDAIKTYMEQENVTRVFGADGIIVKKLIERYSYDFEKVRVVLEASGHKDIWDALCAPDEKKFKKFLTELPHSLKSKLEETKMLTKKYEVLTASMTTMHHTLPQA